MQVHNSIVNLVLLGLYAISALHASPLPFPVADPPGYESHLSSPRSYHEVAALPLEYPPPSPVEEPTVYESHPVPASSHHEYQALPLEYAPPFPVAGLTGCESDLFPPIKDQPLLLEYPPASVKPTIRGVTTSSDPSASVEHEIIPIVFSTRSAVRLVFEEQHRSQLRRRGTLPHPLAPRAPSSLRTLATDSVAIPIDPSGHNPTRLSKRIPVPDVAWWQIYLNSHSSASLAVSGELLPVVSGRTSTVSSRH